MPTPKVIDRGQHCDARPKRERRDHVWQLARRNGPKITRQQPFRASQPPFLAPPRERRFKMLPEPACRQYLINILWQFRGKIAPFEFAIRMVDVDSNRSIWFHMRLGVLNDLARLPHSGAMHMQYQIVIAAVACVIARWPFNPTGSKSVDAHQHIARHELWQRLPQRTGAVANQQIPTRTSTTDHADPAPDQERIQPPIMPKRRIKDAVHPAA